MSPQDHRRHRDKTAPRPGVPEPNRTPQARFENPYHFVPALPRARVPRDSFLADAPPAGHHRLLPDRYTGRIMVELETKTPLLIPGLPRSESGNGHKTFGIRLDEQGRPYLPPTSLKGMLRAAFEAVTNSRFAVFSDTHKYRFGHRQPAAASLSLVPCRIVACHSKNTNGTILWAKLLSGDSKIGEGGKPQGDKTDRLMYAAWLPRYRKYYRATEPATRDKEESGKALKYPDGGLPQHGDKVWVKCERKAHRSGQFSYLEVTAIRKASPGEKPPSGWKTGWVFVSGPNVMNKHEERVFLESSSVKPLPIADDLKEAWRQLIIDYQRLHEEELRERKQRGERPWDYLGHDPGQTDFSRHVYQRGAEELKEGTLCYADIETDKSGKPLRVRALYPVSISRDLYPAAPRELLPAELHPATAYDKLSPADRVFGWVAQEEGEGAYKGQVRIHSAVCLSENAIAWHQQAYPLAILGQPKPAQSRFYAARDTNGTPFDKGVAKDETYTRGQGLRGRKVYLHHRLAAEVGPQYWRDNGGRVEALTAGSNTEIYREWMRLEASGTRADKQNRSVTAWVKPGVKFHFTLDFTNLAREELGALLWLLDLPEGHFHRLGGGKPLGFGSVRLSIRDFWAADGSAWAEYWRAFAPGDRPQKVEPDRGPFIEAYRQAVVKAYGDGQTRFEALKMIRAFLNAARGGDLPVHYPRADTKPDPQGKNYEWFVANESENNRYALPALWKNAPDRGLPILTRSKKK